MPIKFSPTIIQELSDLFFNTEEQYFYEVESTLRAVFLAYPQNVTFNDVLIKATLLNSLYYTQIYSITTISQHICDLQIDTKINVNNITAVDDIRIGHGIGGQKERDFYSFATKYLHFHKPDNFPIYDQLVKRFLSKLNKEIQFHSRFTQNDLLDYSLFKSVIDSLNASLNIPNFGYREFDKGLWVYSKYLFKRNELSRNFAREIRSVLQNNA